MYGTMGRGELPLEEKLLIVFALATLVPVRLVFGMSVLVFYYSVCRVCTFVKDPGREDEQEDMLTLLAGGGRSLCVSEGSFPGFYCSFLGSTGSLRHGTR